MKYRHLVFWVLLFLFNQEGYAADKPVCNRPFTLALHEHGLLYSADNGTGIDKDIAQELARRSACQIKISVMPRDRIWQLIESGALDFSLSGITTPERERYAAFAWYVSNKYYLMVRNDAAIQQVAAFEGSGLLQLGVIRSFRYSPSANALVDHLSAQGRITNATGLEPLYQLLMANRIQAMIIEPFDYPATESAALRNATHIIEFGDAAVPHGLIMSRASLKEVEQVKWRALIDSMRKDGTMQRIFEKYFQPDLAKSMLDF